MGNLAALENPDASLGGLVSRYSIIHLAPSQLDDVEIDRRDPHKDGRPFEQATVLAARFAS